MKSQNNTKRRALTGMFLLVLVVVVSVVGYNVFNSSDEEFIEVTEEVSDVIEKYKDEPVVEIEKPPMTEQKEEIIKEKSAQSPFVNLGCCQDFSKRGTECCYKPVLQKFKTMLEENDPKLGEYKSTDPILGACRQAIPKAFEAVEDEFYADDESVE